MDLDPERVQRLGRDHQTLLRLIEEIVAAAAARPASTGALEEAILGFTEQLCDHVAAEQDLMHELSYPASEPHAAEHDRLLQEASDLLPSRGHSAFWDDALDGARALEMAMYQHIITWDWNLLDYVKKVRPQADNSV